MTEIQLAARDLTNRRRKLEDLVVSMYREGRSALDVSSAIGAPIDEKYNGPSWASRGMIHCTASAGMGYSLNKD